MSESSAGILIAGAAVRGGASAIVKEFLKGVVIPYLKSAGSDGGEAKIRLNISKYLKTVENKTRYISTFATPSGAVLLEDLYEPLSLKCKANKKNFLIDGYPRRLFEESRCVAITDDAGMGKSTIAKYLVRRAIYEQKGIPLLIELRRLRAGQSIVSCLCKDLAESDVDSPEAGELIRLFSQGNFIFILDGFDEIEESIRSAVVDEVNEIAARFCFCYFVITSRPEYSTSLFPAFMEFGIDKLERDQAESLIDRCDAGRGIGGTLISKIDEADVSEFLGSPLLVTLLYRAFDYRNSVPPKRVIFFRQVYDALFQDHDLAKGDAFARKKESGLDSEDFHKLVRAIGFETFRAGRVSYASEEIVGHINLALGRVGFDISANKVLQDLLKAVPIFQRDGVEVKWSHKSFQEYFASQYIYFDAVDRRREIIDLMFRNKDCLKYREIFRFLSEYDVDLLRSVCILPLINEVKELYPEVDVSLASVHFAVDLYYIPGIDRKNRKPVYPQIEQSIKSNFGFELKGRLTALSADPRYNFAFLGVMRDRGTRFLLLPVIDKRNFPEIGRVRWDARFKELSLSIGECPSHLNSCLGALVEVVEKVGSSKEVEIISKLSLIRESAVIDVQASCSRLIFNESDNVLAGF